MSKEMREQIDKVKNWKQFLNENKTVVINDNIISFDDYFFSVEKEDYKRLKNDKRIIFIEQSPQTGKFIFVIPKDNFNLFKGVISDELGLSNLRILNHYEKESIKIFW
jgi:hypothetical protein